MKRLFQVDSNIHYYTLLSLKVLAGVSKEPFVMLWKISTESEKILVFYPTTEYRRFTLKAFSYQVSVFFLPRIMLRNQRKGN